jgi:hypothetical protein
MIVGEILFFRIEELVRVAEILKAKHSLHDIAMRPEPGFDRPKEKPV